MPVRGYEGDKEGDVRARYEGFMRRYIRLPLTLTLALILTLTITLTLTLTLTLPLVQYLSVGRDEHCRSIPCLDAS